MKNEFTVITEKDVHVVDTWKEVVKLNGVALYSDVVNNIDDGRYSFIDGKRICNDVIITANYFLLYEGGGLRYAVE